MWILHCMKNHFAVCYNRYICHRPEPVFMLVPALLVLGIHELSNIYKRFVYTISKAHYQILLWSFKTHSYKTLLWVLKHTIKFENGQVFIELIGFSIARNMNWYWVDSFEAWSIHIVICAEISNSVIVQIMKPSKAFKTHKGWSHRHPVTFSYNNTKKRQYLNHVRSA